MDALRILIDAMGLEGLLIAVLALALGVLVTVRRMLKRRAVRLAERRRQAALDEILHLLRRKREIEQLLEEATERSKRLQANDNKPAAKVERSA